MLVDDENCLLMVHGLGLNMYLHVFIFLKDIQSFYSPQSFLNLRANWGE